MRRPESADNLGRAIWGGQGTAGAVLMLNAEIRGPDAGPEGSYDPKTQT